MQLWKTSARLSTAPGKYLMVCLLGTALWLAGCGRPGQEPGVFYLNIPFSLHSLDPQQARTQASVWMCQQLYSGLVELDSLLQPQPAAARSWHISPDGLTYTFVLNSEARFAGRTGVPGVGRLLRAQDVVWSFRRLLAKSTASAGASQYAPWLEGGTAYATGQQSELPGVAALNDSVVQFRLLKPHPAWLALLAQPYAAVLCPEACQHLGNRLGQEPVGCGPFVLHRWTQGKLLVLHPNPNYFGHKSTLRAVAVRFISSKLTAFAEFRQGRLDFIEGIDPSFKDELVQPDGRLAARWQGRCQMQTAPQLSVEYLALLCDSSLPASASVRNPALRLALHLALDRQQLVAQLFNHTAQAGVHGMVPPGLHGYPYGRVRLPRPNAARARALVDSLRRAGALPETLLLVASPQQQVLMEYLQRVWQQLGLKVELQPMEGSALIAFAAGGQAGVWKASWMADYPDAENFLSLMDSRQCAPAGPNRMRYRNAAFDTLLAQALKEPSDSLRQQQYAKAEALAMRDLPLLPLYYPRTIRLTSHRFTGMPISAMNLLLPLKYVQARR